MCRIIKPPKESWDIEMTKLFLGFLLLIFIFIIFGIIFSISVLATSGNFTASSMPNWSSGIDLSGNRDAPAMGIWNISTDLYMIFAIDGATPGMKAYKWNGTSWVYNSSLLGSTLDNKDYLWAHSGFVEGVPVFIMSTANFGSAWTTGTQTTWAWNFTTSQFTTTAGTRYNNARFAKNSGKFFKFCGNTTDWALSSTLVDGNYWKSAYWNSTSGAWVEDTGINNITKGLPSDVGLGYYKAEPVIWCDNSDGTTYGTTWIAWTNYYYRNWRSARWNDSTGNWTLDYSMASGLTNGSWSQPQVASIFDTRYSGTNVGRVLYNVLTGTSYYLTPRYQYNYTEGVVGSTPSNTNVTLWTPLNNTRTNIMSNLFTANVSTIANISKVELYVWNSTSYYNKYTASPYSLCMQEFTNISACYNTTASNPMSYIGTTVCGNWSGWIDGDWTTTYTFSGTWLGKFIARGCGGANVTSFSNYTRPATAVSALWRIRSNVAARNAENNFTFTIPNACWNQTTVQLALSLCDSTCYLPTGTQGASSQLFCYNTSGAWNNFGTSTGYFFLEEQIQWNYSTPTYNIQVTLPYSDTYKWNFMTNDSTSVTTFAPYNYTLTLHNISPVVMLNSPVNNTFYYNFTQNYNCSATDTSSLTNISFYIWNSTNSIVYNENRSITGTSNSTLYNFTASYSDIYKWNCLAIDDYTNMAFNRTNYTITFDRKSPNITFIVPGNSSIGLVTGSNFNLNIILGDYKLNYSYYNITNSSGAQFSYNQTNLSTTSYTWTNTINISTYIEGNYTITVFVKDYLNNNFTNSSWIYIDRTPPTVTLIYPTNNYITNITPQRLYCNATDMFAMKNISLYVWNSSKTQLYTTQIPSSRYCYQETTNAANAQDGVCNLNYTGGYYTPTPSGWNCGSVCNGNTMYDGIWTTQASQYPSTGVGFMYANYTKPVGSLSTSLWVAKHGQVSPITHNMTLPISCWNADPYKLQLMWSDQQSGSAYWTNWSCYNGTNWSIIYNNSGDGGVILVFEEAMWWDFNYSAQFNFTYYDNYTWNCLAYDNNTNYNWATNNYTLIYTNETITPSFSCDYSTSYTLTNIFGECSVLNVISNSVLSLINSTISATTVAIESGSKITLDSTSRLV